MSEFADELKAMDDAIAKGTLCGGCGYKLVEGVIRCGACGKATPKMEAYRRRNITFVKQRQGEGG